MSSAPIARLGILLALVKFRYHVTFVSVICGALLFAPVIDGALLGDLALLYVSFNVLFYGGVYTLNDIADRAADARHPRKQHRPVASGAIGVRAAAIVAATLIALGLALAIASFARAVTGCFVIALAANLAYSGAGRNRRYLDLLLNSVTHPNRFLMGALLVDRVPPATHLVAIMLLAVALSCLRRHVERDSPGWESRATIGAYAPGELAACAVTCLVTLGALTARLAPDAPGFYALVATTTSLVAIAGWFDSPVRKGLREVWTR